MDATGLSEDTMRGIITIILLLAWVAAGPMGVPIDPDLKTIASIALGYYLARRMNGDNATFRASKKSADDSKTIVVP